jgi:hypothetical protein
LSSSSSLLLSSSSSSSSDAVFDGAEERQEKNEKQFKHAGQTALKSFFIRSFSFVSSSSFDSFREGWRQNAHKSSLNGVVHVGILSDG